jgi:beta-lactamase regulating signal transducer with metallopeptidase domain
MPNLMPALDVFLSWLWRTTCEASVVILLVGLAQLLLNRQLSARWRHGLWLLVVIRLLLPRSVETPLSIFNYLSSQWPVRSTLSTTTTSTYDLPVANVTPDPALPDSSPTPSKGQNPWRAALRWVWLGGAGFVFAQLA